MDRIAPTPAPSRSDSMQVNSNHGSTSHSNSSFAGSHLAPANHGSASKPAPAKESALSDIAAVSCAQLLTRWKQHCEKTGPRDLLLSWSVPLVPSAWLLQHEDFAFHFSQDSGTEVGFGTARALPTLPADLSATEVFQHCSQWAHRLGPCFTGCEHGEEVLPRVYGGIAFQPEAQRDERWQSFGSARFVLPRFSYRINDALATASVYIAWDEQTSLELWLDRARSWSQSLSQLRAPAAITPSPITETTSDDAWLKKVTDIVRGISDAAFSKVVAARHWDHQFDAPISAAATLSALSPSSPAALGSTTLFAFRADDAVFLGATPERLIWVKGERIQSLALAGTFGLDNHQLRDELLVSPKERLEHTPVLHSLVAKLSPFCETLDYSTTPELQTHAHFLHLRTPLTGTLKAQVHILQLVEALHPTPAVGGVPTEAALNWLANNEGFDRGWYAGPVGWFDASGNGEFVVALRCGLLQANHARLFAGAGIVAGSEPLKELAETEWKLRALKDALRLRT